MLATSNQPCLPLFLGFGVLIAGLHPVSVQGEPLSPQAATDCSFLLLPEKAESWHSQTAQLQKAFEEVYEPQVWLQGTEESAVEYQRLIQGNDWRKGDNEHPVDIYGEESWLAFKEADFLLHSIPRGQFKLSTELIQNVHRAVTRGVHSGLRKIHYAGLPGTLLKNPGEFKKVTNYGFFPLTESISEEAYRAVKENPDLEFLELPFGLSRKNARRGVIRYVPAKDAPSRLEELCDWANSAVQKGEDPVAVAAIFQRRFVAIHPFADGNGRTSRLLMDRILIENGIAPPILADHNMDLFVGEKEWIERVREGARATIRNLEKKDVFNSDVYLKNNALLDVNENALMPKEQLNWTGQVNGSSEGIKPTRLTQFIRQHGFIDVNGKRLHPIIGKGLVHDRYGQVHVLLGKQLTPITDRTYAILEQTLNWNGSSWNIAKNRTERWAEAAHKSRQSGKPDVQGVRWINFDTIRDATRENSVQIPKEFLEDFTKSSVFRPKEDLIHSLILIKRENQTTFEWNAEKKQSPRLGDLLAQYQKFDIEADALASDIASQAPKAARQLHLRRARARELVSQQIRRMKQEWDALSAKDREILLNHPVTSLTLQYLKYTPFSADFHGRAFVNDFEQSIYLLREDSAALARIGIFSDQEVRRYLKLIPGAKALAQKIIRDPSKFGDRIKRLLANMGLKEKSDLIDKVFNEDSVVVSALSQGYRSVYNGRRADVEFRRAFVEYALHAMSSSGSAFISFSSSPSLYGRALLRGGSAFSLDKSASLYLVRVPRQDVVWNNFSSFAEEYEFLTKRRIGTSDFMEVIKLEGTDEQKLKDGKLKLSKAGHQFFTKYILPADWLDGPGVELLDAMDVPPN